MSTAPDAPWFVDAMNVMGSRPDGWWRDRDAALARLLDQLRTWAGTEGVEVVLVADGRPGGDLPEGRHGTVTLHHASRGGRDAADDLIVDLVAHERRSAVVVTADRDLRARVEELGASVVGPRTLLSRIGP